jgi:hypothetical protein
MQWRCWYLTSIQPEGGWFTWLWFFAKFLVISMVFIFILLNYCAFCNYCV